MATLKPRSRRTGRARRERIDPVLLVVFFAVATTQMASGVVVPVLPAYAEEFGAGATELGLVVAMFGIGRLVVNVPAGVLSQRVDPRKLLVGAVLGVVALQVATGFAPNLTALLACRLVLGLAGGTAITCGMVLVSRLHHHREPRARNVATAGHPADRRLGQAGPRSAASRRRSGGTGHPSWSAD